MRLKVGKRQGSGPCLQAPVPLILGQACLLSFLVRFIVLANNYLQIRGIRKTDEGTAVRAGSWPAREVNFKDIQVIVNGKETRPSAPPRPRLGSSTPSPKRTPVLCLVYLLFVCKDTPFGSPSPMGTSVQFWNVLHYPRLPEGTRAS